MAELQEREESLPADVAQTLAAETGPADPDSCSGEPAVTDSDGELRCWICLGGKDEMENGEMIQPCGCRGTQRLCHKGCITSWLKVRLGGPPHAGNDGGVAPAEPLRRPGWVAQFLRYNGLFTMMYPPETKVINGVASSRPSLACSLCGQNYALRNKPLSQMTWPELRGFVLPIAGMLFAMLMLCLKLYTKWLRMSVTRDLQTSVNQLTGGRGRSHLIAGRGGLASSQQEEPRFFSGFSLSSWGMSIFLLVSVLRLGTHLYSMIGYFKLHFQSVRAQTVVVDGQDVKDKED